MKTFMGINLNKKGPSVKNYVTRIEQILFLGSLCLLLINCASEPEKPVTKAHSATFINDMFPVDNGMPVREVKRQDFFFKHCSLEERRPYFSAVEYSCTNITF